MWNVYLILLSSVTLFCDCQILPDNQCPSVFKYVRDNGLISGQAELPNDFSGNYRLVVNMSVATVLPQNQGIQIKLLSNQNQIAQGGNLVFRILFPMQNIIPRIHQLIFNGASHCFASVDLTSGLMTYMWSDIVVRLTKQPGQNFNNQNLNNQNTFQNQNGFPSQNNFNNQNNFQDFSVSTFDVPTNNQGGNVNNQNIDSIIQAIQQGGANPTNNYQTPRPVPPQQFPSSSNFGSSQNQVPSSQIPSSQIPLNQIPSSQIPSNQVPTSQNQPVSAQVENVPNRGPSSDFEDTQCGIVGDVSVPFIVGGTQIKQDEYPWLVAIFVKVMKSYTYICTGNLISNRFMVSAGHCFKTGTETNKKEDYVLALGKRDITNWILESTVRGVDNIYVHSTYKPNTADYDIAVVKFNRDVEFSKSIRALCLWDESDDFSLVGATGWVAGWGADGEDDHTQIAKKIDLNITSNEDCIRSHWAYTKLTSSRTFCAGGKGVGPCSGDSGAGLIIERDGFWNLRGIVSTALSTNGKVTCNVGKYIVFADVKSFIPWIKQLMS